MADLDLSSPAFDDGERIPAKYGYTEDNVSPPLEIGDVPSVAESLLLVVDDPDAKEPAGRVWDHWLCWSIPPDTESVPEGSTPAGATEGQNDYGGSGWGGPNPPDREHTYRFLLYALNTDIELGPEATKDDLYDAASGNMVGKAELTGTYPA